MKRIFNLLSVFLLISFHFPVHAQTDSFSAFDSTLKITVPLNYNKVRVIDERKNKSSILSERLSAYLKDNMSLTGMLEKCTNEMISNTQTQDNELLIIVHDFIEDISKDKLVTLYLRAEMFIGKNDSYHFVEGFDDLIEFKGRGVIIRSAMLEFNVGNRKLSNAVIGPAYVFSEILKDAATASTHSVDNDTYSLATARTHLFEKRKQFPIYTANELKRGIYYSPQQFANNHPVDTPFIISYEYLGNMEKIYHAYTIKSNGKKGNIIDPSKFFAFYDGQKWYCHQGMGKIVEITQENNEFYTQLSFDDSHGTRMFLADGNGNSAYMVLSKPTHKVRFSPEQMRFVPVQRL